MQSAEESNFVPAVRWSLYIFFSYSCMLSTEDSNFVPCNQIKFPHILAIFAYSLLKIAICSRLHWEEILRYLVILGCYLLKIAILFPAITWSPYIFSYSCILSTEDLAILFPAIRCSSTYFSYFCIQSTEDQFCSRLYCEEIRR